MQIFRKCHWKLKYTLMLKDISMKNESCISIFLLIASTYLIPWIGRGAAVVNLPLESDLRYWAVAVDV